MGDTCLRVYLLLRDTASRGFNEIRIMVDVRQYKQEVIIKVHARLQVRRPHVQELHAAA